MFKNHITHPGLKHFVIFKWMMMAFSVGILNAVSFIGLGTFATHITGFATLTGIQLALFKFQDAMAALLVPLFFLIGSFISGILVDTRIKQRKKPYYNIVMYISSFIILLITIFCHYNKLIEDPNHNNVAANFSILSLICFVSGLVNAALSTSSSASLRVTHLTGLLSDIGRGLAESFMGSSHEKDEKLKLLKLNFIRFKIIISFTSGAFLGALLFNQFKFDTLLISSFYFLYSGIQDS